MVTSETGLDTLAKGAFPKESRSSSNFNEISWMAASNLAFASDNSLELSSREVSICACLTKACLISSLSFLYNLIFFYISHSLHSAARTSPVASSTAVASAAVLLTSRFPPFCRYYNQSITRDSHHCYGRAQERMILRESNIVASRLPGGMLRWRVM